MLPAYQLMVGMMWICANAHYMVTTIKERLFYLSSVQTGYKAFAFLRLYSIPDLK